MTEIEFLKPRLTGRRFEGHSIPLEFLKDLAVLDEMIVEVAKWQYLQEHGDRKRSPRGFADGIELQLAGIEDGSALPIIKLVIATATLLPPEGQEYFEKARDAIVNAIGAAERGGHVTDFLPEKSLSYFDRLGRSLRDDEAIEFRIDTLPTPARLTKKTRRTLLFASSATEELSEETSVRGAVSEADQRQMTFELQLFDGKRIKAPIEPQHREAILEAFNGYKQGARVNLKGIGRFTRNERLKSIESIEHVTLLDPLDVAARLDELRTLKDGWFEGEGVAPSTAFLDWLSSAMEQHFPEELPTAYLYPTTEGGVRTEWTIGDYELSLEIDPATHNGQWHEYDLAADVDAEQTLTLNNPADWSWLVKRIGEISGVKH